MRREYLFVRMGLVCLFFAFLSVSALAQSANLSEGTLRVTSSKGESRGLCPLKNTDVKAEISGFVARVTVTQTFQNPLAENIEAVYTFPLPNDAAVDEMTMTVGERVINGKIMERQKAQATYEQAKQDGKTTALLEQQRPNIFTQAVANITPNAEIKVVISYVETLKYADDTYEFRFPMTIGERYLPLSVDRQDAAKISPKSATRPAQTVSLEVNLDAGVSVENLSSLTHEIETQQFSAGRFSVRLRDENEIPNRDFVLKYRTAGQKLEDAVLTHRGANGGFFSLVLQPPDRIMPTDTMPKEIVFVLDTSGSMSGFPINKAKEAMNLTLDNLNPNDTFNLITFAGATKILFEQPVQATKENLSKARKFLSDSNSGGGTEMMAAIRAALAPSDSEAHIRIVCFMTDGQVGNDYEILSEVQKHPHARVFSFGIGDSVNHFLLDEMSREGRGKVEYVGLKDDGSAAARRFYERIRNPLLTDISLEFEGLETDEVFPQMIPDVFDAEPVTVVGRYKRGGRGKIILRGKMQGQPVMREIVADFPDEQASNDVLATIWARRKIADLTRRDYGGLQKKEFKADLQTIITNLGLEFKLLTPFTSFVAVDEQIVTDGTAPKRVEVPVAAPNNGSETLPNGANFSSLLQTVPNTQNSVNGASGVTAVVEVTADRSSNIDSTDTKIDTNITTQTLDALPRGRSFQSLISGATGVTQTAERRSQAQASLFSINGQRSNSNVFTVDGLNVNTAVAADETFIAGKFGRIPGLTASGGTNGLTALDATVEVTVRSLGEAGEQRTGGAIVNIVTKSGNNTFRGSLFETFGNENLNANDPFAKALNQPRAPLRVNQFGGTFGGYFRRDKAWFFGNYEGLRLRQNAFAVSEVPNFSVRQTASASMQAILKAFPMPNGRATNNNLAEFSTAFTNPAAHDIFGLRLDFQPTAKLRYGGRFNSADSTATLRGNDYSLNTLRKFDNLTDSVTGWATFTPTPDIVIDGRAGFSQNRLRQSFTLDNFGGADISGLLWPDNFDFLKFDPNGRNSALAMGRRIETTVTQFEAEGRLVWIAGRHTLDFGAHFRRLKGNFGASSNERSVLSAGVNAAGTAERISEISRRPRPNSAITDFSLYGQDKWRISSRVNLNFGLRWDADLGGETDPSNLLGFQNASTEIPNNFANFAPRTGLAWDIFGDGRAVLRGSFGLFFDYGNGGIGEVSVNSAPFAAAKFARNVPFADAPNTALNPLIVFADDLKTPRTWQFFGEYQQEIIRNQMISVSYTGAFGRELLLTRTISSVDPNFGFVRLTDNAARSDFQSLQFRYDGRFSSKLFFNFRYALSQSTDNFSPDTFRENFFLSNDLSLERGASDFDVRHQFNASVIYNLPTLVKNGWLKTLTENWAIIGMANRRTAFPLNVTYARVNNFAVERRRPDLNTQATPFLTENGLKRLNLNAFSIPNEDRQGTLPRNALRGFGLFQFDASLQKRFKFGERSLTLAIEAFNLLNNVNLAEPSADLGTQLAPANFQPNAFFGQSVSTFGSGNFTSFYLHGGPRTLQFSAKFNF